ncbi:hypothetical protein B5K11_26310 [Rhizobium leguminosarum bv. trifolii]|uniref:hypothetical protein n=1 Tax=Rhizobium leguminosarum TaxID=384 RepID=UPI000E2EBF62|nr:hypothetical protein [Rhizobium leguminosarum]RFB87660.1 hypothetical protein B5K11_26310 [Rhizobium leguminosarum bv. trifolii]
MSQKHLTQIWQGVSLALLLFLITSVISIQGGSEFIGKLFGDSAAGAADNKPAIGYFGAVIGGVLFLVASSILSLHARRHGNVWHERIPVLWLEGLNTSTWEGRTFQAIVVVIFLVLPAAGIVKCIAEAETGDICELDKDHFYRGSETTLLWPPVAIDGQQMRLRREGAGSDPCKTGIEIFPRFGTPATAYGVPLLGGCMGVAALILIFLRRSGVDDAQYPLTEEAT